eukprot:symbB.v1.2.005323.t2/scaffold278.1/size243006/4
MMFPATVPTLAEPSRIVRCGRTRVSPRLAVVSIPEMSSRCVVPLPYSRWLLCSCTQFSLMTLGAAAHRRWGCCILSTLVLFAGLNYWRRATFGLRRYADMLAVAVTVLLILILDHGAVSQLCGLWFLGQWPQCAQCGASMPTCTTFSGRCWTFHTRIGTNRICFDDCVLCGHVYACTAFCFPKRISQEHTMALGGACDW